MSRQHPGGGVRCGTSGVERWSLSVNLSGGESYVRYQASGDVTVSVCMCDDGGGTCGCRVWRVARKACAMAFAAPSPLARAQCPMASRARRLWTVEQSLKQSVELRGGYPSTRSRHESCYTRVSKVWLLWSQRADTTRRVRAARAAPAPCRVRGRARARLVSSHNCDSHLASHGMLNAKIGSVIYSSKIPIPQPEHTSCVSINSPIVCSPARSAPPPISLPSRP
jgi:hypothetical protein